MNLTIEQIQEFKNAIAKADTRNGLAEFAVLLGKTLPDVWVEEKFRAFRTLNQALSQLSPELIRDVTQ